MAVSHLKSLQALELALRLGSLRAAAGALWITPADEIHIATTSDFAELWLRPRVGSFKAAHPHVLFCINGEGDAPLRIGQVDCEIGFGAEPANDGADLLFADFVLPIGSPENTRRISSVGMRDRLEGFPLLHLDFYREDPRAPNWPAWIRAQRLKRTEPTRGMRFQRIRPALDAVLANAGLTLCGLALLAPYIEDGSVSLPFPTSTGRWTAHVFRARFRSDALLRPQVKRFREWLAGQAGMTRAWLAQHVASKQASRKRSVRRR